VLLLQYHHNCGDIKLQLKNSPFLITGQTLPPIMASKRGLEPAGIPPNEQSDQQPDTNATDGDRVEDMVDNNNSVEDTNSQAAQITAQNQNQPQDEGSNQGINGSEDMLNSSTNSGGVGGSSGGSGGGQQMTTEEYENTKPDELKKDIRMISGCHDKQTSADVSNVSSFQLPDPAGKFISVLWALDLYFYIAIHIICYCLLGCVVEVFALHYCHVHWLVFHIYHLLITNSMHTFIKQVRLAEHAHLLF